VSEGHGPHGIEPIDLFHRPQCQWVAGLIGSGDCDWLTSVLGLGNGGVKSLLYGLPDEH
jgi:hypothetical protein